MTEAERSPVAPGKVDAENVSGAPDPAPPPRRVQGCVQGSGYRAVGWGGSWAMKQPFQLGL